MVDASGNVTAKGAGTATITIKADAKSNYNAVSKQITVTVARAAQRITTKVKASSAEVGKTVCRKYFYASSSPSVSSTYFSASFLPGENRSMIFPPTVILRVIFLIRYGDNNDNA